MDIKGQVSGMDQRIPAHSIRFIQEVRHGDCLLAGRENIDLRFDDASSCWFGSCSGVFWVPPPNTSMVVVGKHFAFLLIVV